LAALTLLAGCTGQKPSQSTTTPGAPGKAASGAPLRIAVIPKGTVHQFWRTVKAGADAAAKEFNAEIQWKGPSEETDVTGQVKILENAITQKVDAIVMAAVHQDALVPTIQKAKDAGIPVVTIDSGVNSNIPVTLVATDNAKGAEEGAKELARLLGDKGKVGLIPFVHGAATSDQRQKGFEDEIKRHPGIQIASTLYSDSKTDKAMQATENMLTANPGIGGIFGANEPGALGAAQALEGRGLIGKVKLVGFDASEGEIARLKQGAIQALVVQNPFKMGYEGVKAAVETLRGKKVAPRIDTGVTVVTAANINQPDVQKLLYPMGK
jgi:ribose transport system substrate-binding protein